MTAVALDGITNQTSTGNTADWNVVNARGTDAAWSLSASITNFESAAGTVDTTARSLATSNLVITPGTVTASSGADGTSAVNPYVATITFTIS